MKARFDAVLIDRDGAPTGVQLGYLVVSALDLIPQDSPMAEKVRAGRIAQRVYDGMKQGQDVILESDEVSFIKEAVGRVERPYAVLAVCDYLEADATDRPALSAWVLPQS